MKNSKKVFGNAGQSTTEVKKPHKHDANLQKNSTLYFQIGLILCLLGTYSLFEMQFQEKKIVIDTIESNDLATIDVADKFRVEPDVIPEKKEKQVRQTVITNKLKEVDDNFIDKDPVDLVVSDPTPLPDAPTKIDDINVIDIPDDLPPVDFIHIENAPLYPGCEKYKKNKDRKKCMSEKIGKLVNRKFDSSIASEHGITGLQRIYTQFTVDKNGNVSDIKIRAPHPALEKEAKRVINKIPHMKPGYQQMTPVGVIYTLPITFQVRD